MISNLLGNALKYTPSGGRVALSVSSEVDHARLAVQDSGIGIAPADQERLFERLWRAGGADQPEGSGIGLAVAAELVSAHRGTIEVESEPGHGSRSSSYCPKPAEPVAASRFWAQASGRSNSGPTSDSGRGPKMRRSLSRIGRSLMLASRRRIRPSSSNSQFSLP